MIFGFRREHIKTDFSIITKTTVLKRLQFGHYWQLTVWKNNRCRRRTFSRWFHDTSLNHGGPRPFTRSLRPSALLHQMFPWPWLYGLRKFTLRWNSSRRRISLGKTFVLRRVHVWYIWYSRITAENTSAQHVYHLKRDIRHAECGTAF